MRDSFDNENDPFEGLQILSTDTAEDLANLLLWKESVLKPWVKPRRSVDTVKPEDVTALGRREKRRGK